MKYKITSWILSILIIVTAITIQARDIKQVKVYIEDKTLIRSLDQMSLDIVEHGENYFTIITNSTELLQIQSLGVRTEIIHDDIVEHYQKRLNKYVSTQESLDGQTMGGYKTLDEINSAVDFMILFYPTLISNKVVIGQTLEGRDIWAVKISDNPNIDEDETEMLYYSATHSREVITPEVLLYFMDHLLANYGIDSEITDIVDNREIWFILNVNPDGYVHNEVIEPLGGGMWRKNRRNNGDGTFGVDINRNYGFKWGLDDVGSSPTTSSETYRGTAPFSEPATQAMRDFCEAHNFVICVDYHAYSNLFLWPWGYDYLYTEDENLFALMGDSVSAYNGYTTGPGWSLYLVNGEAGDWMYGEQTTKNKNLHVLFEVGSSSQGFWPNPADISSLVEENLGPNIFLAKIAADVYQRVPPKTPSIIVDALVDSVSYTVDWSLIDTMNPAIEYELIELQGNSTTYDNADNFDNWNNSGFLIEISDYVSPPSAFYSTSGDNLFTTMTTINPYLVPSTDSIQFKTKYDIETDWDYAFVEISTDGLNFTSIEGNITTSYNPYGNNNGHGITGTTSGGWIDAHFNISSYAGQNIYIRLTYKTDGYVSEDGFRVDDFYPVVSFASETIISSSIIDTTYTFNDKPIGIYYYKVKGKDAENQWSNFSQITKTNVVPSLTDCVAGGDVNNDGINLSVSDYVYLIQFLQGIVPTLELPYKADLNGDCIISPLDSAMYQCVVDNGLICLPIFPVPTCCVVDIDRDGDGIFDPDEQTLATNYLDDDSDGDSIDDLTEVGDVSNPVDTDADGIIDALDPDDDNDGIPTIDEIANGDTDLDGIPDYLDDDDDNDGVLTIDDNCPLIQNPLQVDADSDGLGDACDACCIADRGNVNGGPDNGTVEGSIDIADLIFLVGYAFSDGDQPPCIEEADINGSGGVVPIDISDIVALVNFMFKGGDPPASCF